MEPWHIEIKPIPKDPPLSAYWKSTIRSTWLSNLSFYDQKSIKNDLENYNIEFMDMLLETCAFRP